MIRNDNRIDALSVFKVPPLLEKVLSGFKQIDFISFIYCSKEVLAGVHGSPKLKGRARCLTAIQEYLFFKQKETEKDESKLETFQYSVIHYQIEFGLLKAAYRKIENLPVSIPKVNILVTLAKVSASEDAPLDVNVLLNEATVVAKALPTNNNGQIAMSSGARIDLGNMLSRADLLDEADEVLKPLVGQYKVSKYTGKVDLLIEEGRFADAVETAAMIFDPLIKRRMLFKIAEIQLKAGHEAFPTFVKAMQTGSNHLVTPGDRLEMAPFILLFISSETALTFLNRLVTEEKISCLLRIAEELGMKGYHEKATPLFTRALELIHTIEDMDEKKIHISSLVRSQIKFGHLNSALELANQFSLVNLQQGIADELISRGEFDQALKILEGIQPPINFYRTFIYIAEIQYGLKKPEEALAALAKAIAIDPTRTNEILMLTAKIQAAIGHVDEAFETMNQIPVEYKPGLIKELFKIFK